MGTDEFCSGQEEGGGIRHTYLEARHGEELSLDPPMG
jgi:hypothetical protein